VIGVRVIGVIESQKAFPHHKRGEHRTIHRFVSLCFPGGLNFPALGPFLCLYFVREMRRD